MKPTNINVVSTPNIEGNIGSCSLSSDTVTVRGGLLTQEKMTAQVNSCTGEIVNTTKFIDYQGAGLLLVVLGLFICFLLFMVMIDRYY